MLNFEGICAFGRFAKMTHHFGLPLTRIPQQFPTLQPLLQPNTLEHERPGPKVMEVWFEGLSLSIG